MTATPTFPDVWTNAAQARPNTFPQRFTLDGDEALEHHLAETCDRIARGIRGLIPAPKLEAVLLGGGYGRGEGGVLRTADGDQPYNDLEFYVCVRGNRHWNERRYGRALHTLAEILTPQAGVEVEFRITSLVELERASVSMFSYDLVHGHRCIVGDDSALTRCRHHAEPTMIPISEATRLLMNRVSGLLFAAERLKGKHLTAAEVDFVARNIAKAQLGAGDAVLTAYGEYDWSVGERHRRLVRLARLEGTPWLADVARHHAVGTEFKLHPTRPTSSRDHLTALHAQVSDFCRETWLWLEGRRLRRHFRSLTEYVRTPIKCPESRRLRNLLVNAKALGAGAVFRSDPLRHPRERILTALPILLWEESSIEQPAQLRRLQRELNITDASFSGLVRAYRSIWSHVN